MDLFRLMFLNMAVNFFKAARRSETRLVYGFPGPPLVIASIVMMLTRMPPALSVTTFLTGSCLMRIQASMIAKRPFKSLRNGALLIIGFMIFFLIVLRDFIWAPIGLVVAVGLLALHRHHETMLAARV